VLSAPLETPPYYALELNPCLINTQGGPRRNAAARVLDAFGDPIPRLYSAGELGSLWGIIYQGAGNIAECMVFGRIAGRNAAAERPWV
jgi:predicted oxidoreductase